jgi:hypothetical protein
MTKPEQEPVLWITPDGEGWRIRFSPPTIDVPLGWDALYTAPPQRKPLTDEQKQRLVTDWFAEDWAVKKALGLLDDYEAAHNIKEGT